MSSLSMVEDRFPAGFRFHPRDDELVCDYLIPKWNSSSSSSSSNSTPHSLLLTQVDLNKCEPWDIPRTACIGGKEWYFYSKRDRKYATGQRTNRATVSGYWKATGKDRAVVRRGRLVGMRKTLVFYQGRAPKGSKTEWVMHEFRVEPPFPCPNLLSSPSNSKEDWVLCRVLHKNKDNPSPAKTDSYNSMNETTTSVGRLMDSYITFDQTHQQPTTADAPNYQQVPCFSIFSANQSNNNNNNNNNNTVNPTNMIYPQNYHMEAINNNNTSMGGGGSMMAQEEDGDGDGDGDDDDDGVGSSSNLSPTAEGGGGGAAARETCEKRVLEAVLSQLTKMENRRPTISSSGEAASTCDTYLSQLALQHPSLWTTHF